MKKIHALWRHLQLALLSTSLAACGGTDSGSGSNPGITPAPPAASAPPVTSGLGISSVGIAGNTLTVTGGDFGSRVQAAPWHFEDFDARAAGAAPTSFGYYSYGGFGGKVDVDGSTAFSGSRSLRHQGDFGGASTEVRESFPHLALRGFSTNELYISYRLKFATNGSHISQLKFNRSAMEVDGPLGNPCYNGAPKFRSSYYSESNTETTLGYIQGGVNRPDNTIEEGWIGETTGFPGTPFKIPENTWVQVEEYYRLNDIGQANGEYVSYVNGHPHFNRRDLLLRNNANQLLNCSYLVIGMDYYVNPGATNGVTVWYDDHYLDTSRSRLVLANAATWEQATMRSPQPATTWSAQRITAQIKRGGFAPGSNAWVYVVHADGRISAGSPVSLP